MPAQPSQSQSQQQSQSPQQTPSQNGAKPGNRAERRAARRGRPGHAGRPDLPGARSGAHTRGAQGRRVNPIRRTGS